MSSIASGDIEIRVRANDWESLPYEVQQWMQTCNGAPGDGWMLIPKNGILTFLFSLDRWEQIQRMIEETKRAT